MQSRIPSIIAAILLAFPALALPALSRADASVQVRLADTAGRPVDGTVTLTGQGQTRRCTTTAGRCTITIRAGTYTATVAPARGTAPAPRSVVVPASGVITLALSIAAPVTGLINGAAGTQGTTVTSTTSTGGTGTSGGTGSTPGTGTGTTATAVATTTSTTAVRVGTATTTTMTGTTTATTSTASRNLGTGRTIVASGTIVDAMGRPVDARLTVTSGTTVLGTAASTAGRFSLYDLARGSYTVEARTAAGRTARVSLTVGASPARLTVRIP